MNYCRNIERYEKELIYTLLDRVNSVKNKNIVCKFDYLSFDIYIGAAIMIRLIEFVPRLELKEHLFGNLQDKTLGVAQ